VCNADGKSFDMFAWEGKRSPSRRYNDTKWIQTCDPGPRYWECWRLAIRQTFLFPQQHHLRLMQPLGLWHKEADETWKWWIDPTTQRILCHQEDGSWTRASGRTQIGQRTIYNQDTPISSYSVPTTLRRVTVHQPSGSPTISMDGIGFTAVAPIPEVDSLEAAIAILPKDARWALRHVKAPDGGRAIANDIKHGRAIAVSDGSLKASIGTAAFILTGQSIAQAVIGAHVVPGKVKEGDSHRCELSGIFGIVTLTHTITKVFDIHTGTVHVACDNEQALKSMPSGAFFKHRRSNGRASM
jgi:hypothetical protein